MGIGNNNNSNQNAASTVQIDGTANGDGKDYGKSKPASTVRLQLPREEYDQVLSDLTFGRSHFTKEIAEATITLKMGGLWEGLGLTAVAL